MQISPNGCPCSHLSYIKNEIEDIFATVNSLCLPAPLGAIIHCPIDQHQQSICDLTTVRQDLHLDFRDLGPLSLPRSFGPRPRRFLCFLNLGLFTFTTVGTQDTALGLGPYNRIKGGRRMVLKQTTSGNFARVSLYSVSKSSLMLLL